MPRFMNRTRTRSPKRTMRGVVAGPALPLHGRWFRQMVVHDDPNSVAFCHLDRRTRHTSIEAPNVECLAGSNFSADGFGYEVKLLGPVNHLPRELWHIGSFDHQRCAASL